MTYALPDDLIALLPEDELLQLADDSGSAGMDDPAVMAVIEAALDRASCEIDGYVGLVRTVPVDPAPELLRTICLGLTVEGLYLRRGHRELPEGIVARANRYRSLLSKIAEGKLALGAVSGESAEVAAPGTPRVAGANRFYTNLREMM